MSPMACQSWSMVLTALLRNRVFSLAKAISIDGVDGSCSRRRVAP